MAKKDDSHAEKTCETCGTCPTCGSRPGQTVVIRTYPVPYYPWPQVTQPYGPYWYGMTGGGGTYTGNTTSLSASYSN